MSSGLRLLLAVGLSLLPLTAAAAQDPAEPPTVLPPVTVTAPPPVAASSEVIIPGRDFELVPQGRPADVLRLIPGFIISQHQGGGKAEQYLLRGFDADHGTDVALFVDNLPVNLRSHAHGQGYADLHFLIPETVKLVEAFKGPYFVEFGDFATAGAINFVTLDVVEENLVQAAGGSFNTQRYLTLLSPTRDAVKTLLAIEQYHSDGPFEHPNGYDRTNVFAKATLTPGESQRLTLSGAFYDASWHGSGQLPTRAIRSGLVARFGALDPNEGGKTQRVNVDLDWRWRPGADERARVHVWGSYYRLSLFNDFTLFLNDPAHGDMINQRDERVLAGVDAEYERRARLLGLDWRGTAGVQYRVDSARVVLATAIQRHQTGRTQDVHVLEQSWSPYAKVDVSPADWFRVVAGARGDVFSYDVVSRVNAGGPELDGTVTRARPNVKTNVVLGPWAQTEFFANFGTGYHSTDARAVVADPRRPALPTARGYEFGVKTQLVPRVELSATYWVLDLASELVFVGDAGTTEPRGPSHREGWEIAAKVRLLDWLTFTGDVTTSRAAFKTGAAVPLAPRTTARADLTARLPFGFSSSVTMRYLGDRFADEDRHHTARGYTLVDVSARYRYRRLEAFVSVENVFDVDWREAQFFFTSRLPGESAGGVPDVHFTPGAPRSVLGGVAIRF
jgi:outer membrane receptor protein involved in Fe transport